jgi:signal transduction histidine kinase
MFRLIENLLQWSRIQQGSLPFDPLELDLPPLVMESIDLIVEAAGKKEITIITELPAKLMVIADENFVKTIFRNLLFNAVKFTSRGGKLSICLKKEGEDTALFSIHDSGIGMSADLVENLFINNVSTNRKGTDGEPTTGLGLILCKELVEKMNGRIWAESAENHGSTFYITIPLSSQNTADGFK